MCQKQKTKQWLTVIALVAVVGCETGTSSEKTSVEAASEAVEIKIDLGANQKQYLAMADMKDGQTDNRVCKCAVCALGMDGKVQHSASVSDYQLQFCSDMCLNYFQEHYDEILTLPSDDDESSESETQNKAETSTDNST